jgi:diketogulonate reductase-like aldo/keto reductase
VFQSPPQETVVDVEAAIGEGYRLIDTAAAYVNEREVGEGIRRYGSRTRRRRAAAKNPAARTGFSRRSLKHRDGEGGI